MSFLIDFSVVIPAYNGGAVLYELTDRLIHSFSPGATFEIIFVFDHGREKTWQLLKGIREKYPDLVRVYHLSRNYGQHRATEFGFSVASGKYFITMDEDLQHNPDDIPKMIFKQKEGDYDVVYARFAELKHGKPRNLISEVLRKLLLRIIPHLYKDYSPYRLIKRETALLATALKASYTFIDEKIGRASAKMCSVKAEHRPRNFGESSYTMPKLVRHGILILMEYTRIITWLIIMGLGLSISGLLLILISTRGDLPVKSGFAAILLFGLLLTFIGVTAKDIKRKNNRITVDNLEFSE